MKRATVVIGAQFGDEGKGLVTDYYAHRFGGPRTIVCRFNGGAQAGHTVELADGTRHVFSHFGAGTLAGAGTYLSRHFIVNPLLFGKERALLALVPTVFVDPDAIVTTPYDMIINQIVEHHRGGDRHGSCGLGINETVERSQNVALKITAGELLLGNRETVRETLRTIRGAWLPLRLEALGITTISDAFRELIARDAIVEQYLNAADNMAGQVTIWDADILSGVDDVVFEGAQGLLLSEDQLRFFPHVTRSRTGVHNVLGILDRFQDVELHLNYVTRPYATRHGAGPLPGEDPAMSFPDRTNIDGRWQGALRFAPLDVDLVGEAIDADLNSIDARNGREPASTTLVGTWADVFEGRQVPYIIGGARMRDWYVDVMGSVATIAGCESILAAFGKTREGVHSTRTRWM